MTQVEDAKRQAPRAGGLRAAHGQMKGEQNNCNLFSRPEEQEEVEALVGSSQGSRVMLHQHPVCQTHIDQKQHHTFPATFGAGDNVPLCCYGNTGFVVFFLPLT